MTIAEGLPWDLAFDLETSLPQDLELAASYQPATNVLTLAIENRGDSGQVLPDLRLAAPIGEPAIGGRAHLHGRYMQQDALTRIFGAEPEEGYSGGYLDQGGPGVTYVSREVVAVHLPSRPLPALVVGSLRGDRFFCDLLLHCSDGDEILERLSVTFPMEGTHLEPGERIDLPPLLIGDGHDAWRLLEAYADRVAAEMRARVPDRVPSGWCSWYYFYNRVSEADIIANLEAMQAANHPADYVQVDDGYQSHTGDWLTPNEKFPSGMAALAERIGAARYRPGLWLAPFVMHRDSAVLRDHPEFALATTAGDMLTVETWLGTCAVLDCSHPEAAAWLRQTVSTIVGDWGYTLLKLDAIAFAAQPGDRVRYHVPGTTAPGNVRLGLEIIREAAGDDVFLLGCTCHFAPAIGLVDAMRVGPDVKALWADGTRPSVRHAMRMTLQRNWMHGRWWLNDPDCLVLRDAETELTAAEVRFLAAAVALSGGLVVSSDNLPVLSTERANLARTLMPAAGVAAVPLEPGEGPVPSAWRARLDEARSLVGVLNWSEASRWVSSSEYLEPGEVAFEPWQGKLLGKGDLLLGPHEGTIWQVTAPSPGPRVVGDTGHLTRHGLYERPVSGRLQLRNDSSRPRTVAVEARGRVTTVELTPAESRWFD